MSSPNVTETQTKRKKLQKLCPTNIFFTVHCDEHRFYHRYCPACREAYRRYCAMKTTLGVPSYPGPGRPRKHSRKEPKEKIRQASLLEFEEMS